MSVFRSGFVALMGRPNVGKSTLLNQLVGSKVSIVSPKPQTTRHRVIGIRNRADRQLIYVDTPGIQLRAPRGVNRAMNRVARASAHAVDCVLFVVAASGWTKGDREALAAATASDAPLVLVINKIDLLRDRRELLPLLAQSGDMQVFRDLVPVSAESGESIDRLEQVVADGLPEQDPCYDTDQETDRPESFRAAELVREQLFWRLSEELPYACAVEIEHFEAAGADGLRRVGAVIWIERESQKGIVIGKGGRMLSEIGRAARLEMERVFGGRVYLRLWVRVREAWADDPKALARFGYAEDGA